MRLINKQLATLRSEYWISALESFGLLPNYTLFDDSVKLAVSVNWMNPETQQYEHSQFELTRGSAQALRDFAPGSTFYANGFAIDIDAVDLGANSEEVHLWACCPKCGYVKELSDHRPGDGVPTECAALRLGGHRRHRPTTARRRTDQRLGDHPPRRGHHRRRQRRTQPGTLHRADRRRHRPRRRHQTLVRRQTRLRRQAPA